MMKMYDGHGYTKSVRLAKCETIMTFVFKTRNCVSKTRDFVFKMMNPSGANRFGAASGLRGRIGIGRLSFLSVSTNDEFCVQKRGILCSKTRNLAFKRMNFAEHLEDGISVAYEFRASSCESWFAVLKREMVRVAVVTDSEPARRLDEEMMAATTSAPLLDEDIGCVLFQQAGYDGETVEAVPMAATEVSCTVYLPVEEDVGSHGRVMLIPFTPTTKVLSTEAPIMQIQEELVRDFVQPTMAAGGAAKPGSFTGTPGKACRWALFLHRDLGLGPMRCPDTVALKDIPEFCWQVSHGMQPRLVLADLPSQEEKQRLQGVMFGATTPAAVSEFPELAAFTSTIGAIVHMVAEDIALDHRVAMQQESLLASHTAGSWASSGGTVKKSMINLGGDFRGSTAGGSGEDAIVFQGWLMKKGGSGAGDKKSSSMFKRRNWKTRCVTLSAKCLMYYDSEETAEKGPEFAKGGMFFKDCNLEIFVADDEGKRGHQFFLTGQTVDGGYGGARDLVMCAQSAAEYVEWERLLKMHIARANGGDLSDPNAHDEADKTGFELLVHTALDGPEQEPFVMECDEESTVVEVVKGWLDTKSDEWKTENGATASSTVVYRRASAEVLLQGDVLADYDFVHLALSTHAPLPEAETLQLSLTMQIEQPSPTPLLPPRDVVPEASSSLDFKLHDLRWLRPSDRSTVDESAQGLSSLDEDLDDNLASIIDSLRRDPLVDVKPESRAEIWKLRGEFCAYPPMLAKVIQAVPSWSNPGMLTDIDQLVRMWAKPSPEEALQLLDPRFWAGAEMVDSAASQAENPVLQRSQSDSGLDRTSDTVRVNSLIAREYAVHCLVSMPDDHLGIYMLQLSQLMKLEVELTDSPLAALLMYRALRNPTLIGQSLYWSIRSELYDASVYSHLSLYLRQYMDNCGTHKEELANQERLMGQMRNMIKHIKSERTRRKVAGEDYHIDRLREVLQADLKEIEFPPQGIRMPVAPYLRCKKFRIEKCKVMGSHQVPLWLVFENCDPTAEPIEVMFKDGDDVRQDALVLQLFNIMQQEWEEDGLDIPLRPGTTGAYGCVSVGFEVGVVEVVSNCNTLAGIVKEAELSALGVFDKELYKNWLEKHNPTDELWTAAVDRFTRSCAGYCVATYILGIADRHNDNILLAKTGELIHIDFGHFLGHVTEFLGLNRDKSPFILTDEFVVIMGGAGAFLHKNEDSSIENEDSSMILQ